MNGKAMRTVVTSIPAELVIALYICMYNELSLKYRSCDLVGDSKLCI
jgi:hypothetical protein